MVDFRDFLVRTGVDYLLFDRDHWVQHYFSHEIDYQTYANRESDVIVRLGYANLVNVARDRHAVFDDGDMILLDLRQGRLPGDPPFVDRAAERGRERAREAEIRWKQLKESEF